MSAIVTQPVSAGATFTAYDNQRKTGRLPNNGLLDMIVDGTTANFFFSKDGGATWAAVATGSVTSVVHASLFTDEVDGYIHVMHVNGSSKTYRRGTPTYDGAGMLTAIAWTTINPFSNTATGSWARPDLVSHKEGAGWVTHVVCFNTDGVIKYQRVNISSAGAMTNNAAEITLNGTTSTTGDAASIAIDNSNNLYVTWDAGATGAGKGVRFRMLTYANGNWTLQAEEPITEALFAEFMGPCLVDKAGRAWVAFRDSATGKAFKAYRRAVGGGWSDLSPAGVSLGHLSLTLNSNDDLYAVTIATFNLQYRGYSGGVWGGPVIIPTIGTAQTYPTACRYTDGFFMDVMCITGEAAPWNVEHARVAMPASGGKSRRGYNVTTYGRGRRGVWTV